MSENKLSNFNDTVSFIQGLITKNNKDAQKVELIKDIINSGREVKKIG